MTSLLQNARRDFAFAEMQKFAKSKGIVPAEIREIHSSETGSYQASGGSAAAVAANVFYYDFSTDGTQTWTKTLASDEAWCIFGFHDPNAVVSYINVQVDGNVRERWEGDRAEQEENGTYYAPPDQMRFVGPERAITIQVVTVGGVSTEPFRLLIIRASHPTTV